MIDNNNIILITDNPETEKIVLEKLVLLRKNDNIRTCTYSNIKNALKESLFSLVILVEDEDVDLTLKYVKTIKQVNPDVEVLLVLNKINLELILKAYDSGIYDYLSINSDDYDFMIKAVNCFKYRMQKDENSRNQKFLKVMGVIDSKTGLYHQKYLKDVFIDLTEDLKIRYGTFTILSLDDSNKTKVSTNRLARVLKANLREDDIIAQARGGKFYIILPNIDLIGTKTVLQKIQDKMGENFKLRAGISKIGINSFETLEKNSNDGLVSALQKDVLAVCLEDNIDVQNTWLEDDVSETKTKEYKLFKNAFTNKMENVITPIFYRYQKTYETKLTNTQVSQYANNIECVFSLKNDKVHSELVLMYDGFAKFKLEINHSGLDSAENTKSEVPLNKLTDKLLISLLRQLKDEYKRSAY